MSLIPANIQEILVDFLDDAFLPVLIHDHPFIDRITKRAEGGTAAKVPLLVSYGGGKGGDFGTAVDNATEGGSINAHFEIEPAVAFGIEIVDWVTAPITDTPESAMDVVTTATKGSMYNAVDNFANMIFSDGSGYLATIASNTNPSGNIYTLVLSVPTDADKIAQDDTLVSKASSFAASLDTGTAVVLGVNPIQGSITVDGGGTWTPTNGHVLGIQSQMQASTSVVTFPGIFAFIPPTSARSNGVPTVTSFLGVTRSAQSSVVGVAGWAFDISSGPLFPGINAAAGRMKAYKNATPDTLVCNGVQAAKLAQEVQAQVRFDMPSKSMKAEVFYAGFTIMTAAGPVDVLVESSCPSNRLVLTRADQWIMGSPQNKPFRPSTPDVVYVTDYRTNKARFATTCLGYFYTQNPPATCVLTVSTSSLLN